MEKHFFSAPSPRLLSLLDTILRQWDTNATLSVLTKLIDGAAGLSLCADLLLERAIELGKIAREEQPNDPLLNEQDYNFLGLKALDRIRDAVLSEKIIDEPRLASVLRVWSLFAGDDEVKSWINRILHLTCRNVLNLMGGLLRYSDTMDGEYYYFSNQDIEKYHDMIEIRNAAEEYINRGYGTEEEKKKISILAKGARKFIGRDERSTID